MGGRKFKDTEYKGFEQGPIRPPSEAGSLLIRITRNCPWNRCTFCPVYKGSDFSLRPVEHVLEDINIVHRYVLQIRKSAEKTGKISPVDIKKMVEVEGGYDRTALNAALQWVSNGMGSIFLQDANSLIIKPERLITILIHLQRCFPWVQRVTSYARSHTIARTSDDNLSLIAKAGLNRIHIGMESGSDKVLAAVKKGVDKKTHIRAGLKVKKAGMELSEYVMPGLGGAVLSREHALETADALNKINPDFIRLRTLTIPNHVELFDKYKTGEFRKLNGLETANELLIFLQQLDGITSSLKSDHILNLFEDLEGKFPEDKAKMVGIVSDFLNMSPTDQVTYQVGRRMGMFRGLKDMDDSGRREQVEEICNRNSITPENVDPVIDEMMKRFI
ncbi:MAG: coproporphyrinogen III oxidase [Desulfobulbaceae bacterium S5133MH15]|nr:MAG: coproporphyrinogen III oxidase [Desulfobulbaceae bacterium S5133MH15]OEU80839.1 MAG: coproporphyrinogen III oxidase [Desulfobulbaceae bacterium C00003063]